MRAHSLNIEKDANVETDKPSRRTHETTSVRMRDLDNDSAAVVAFNVDSVAIILAAVVSWLSPVSQSSSSPHFVFSGVVLALVCVILFAFIALSSLLQSRVCSPSLLSRCRLSRSSLLSPCHQPRHFSPLPMPSQSLSPFLPPSNRPSHVVNMGGEPK